MEVKQRIDQKPPNQQPTLPEKQSSQESLSQLFQNSFSSNKPFKMNEYPCRVQPVNQNYQNDFNCIHDGLNDKSCLQDIQVILNRLLASQSSIINNVRHQVPAEVIEVKAITPAQKRSLARIIPDSILNLILALFIIMIVLLILISRFNVRFHTSDNTFLLESSFRTINVTISEPIQN